MEGVSRAVKLFMILVTVITGAITIVMFVIVGLNVYMRYVVNQSLGWADELSRFLFIWMSLLGATMAFEKGQHVGLDFIIDRVTNTKLKLGMLLLVDVLTMVVLVVLFRQGIAMTQAATNDSPALSIHMKYVFAAVPVGVGIMAVLNVLRIGEHVISMVTGHGLGVIDEEETEAQRLLRESIEQHEEAKHSRPQEDEG